MERKTGPFLRSPITIESVMRDVLLALIPSLIAGVIFFGIKALWVVLLSTAAAMVTEMLLLRRPFTGEGLFGDGSAAVTGVLVGLILPSTTAWWVPVIGGIIAIALIKLPFGGLGYNIFNPALGARAILLLAFTSQMVRFALPFDVVTGATPLLTMTSFDWSLVWGNVGGSIGETSVIAILLGAAYLLYKGHIDWRVPVGYVGAAFIVAVLWGLNPWITITAGGLLFGAVFMATDMVTSPVTPMGQLIFGIGCGILTVFIRKFTSLPEGVTFAILVMNALVPVLDKLTMPQRFGVGIPREHRFQGTAVGVGVAVVAIVAALLIGSPAPEAQPVFSGGHYLPVAELLGTTEYSIEDINGTRYYTVRDDEEKLVGAAFVAEQRGFNAPIQFLVALDDEYSISALQILEHKEDPGLGALVTQASFLEQFVGLDADSSFALGTDLDGVSGATISSRAMATGVRRAVTGFMDAFFPPSEAVVGWADGTYTGEADSFGGKLAVEVVVEGGKIADVKVVSHTDTPGISDGAVKDIPQRIVSANSPAVDAVSGATFTSEAIMSAVEKALAGAGTMAAPASTWNDGTYTGTADSFGGKLTVEVVVAGGKIADVKVISHTDTPGISDSAIKEMPQRIVAANGSAVDVVSGATFTSEAIVSAVENALADTTAAPQAPATPVAPVVEAKYDDGTYTGTASSFGGKLTVEVVVSGGAIADVQVVSHSDTPGISDAAIKDVPQRIIAANSPAVDVVSGATFTSEAIMDAVEDALAETSAAAGAENVYSDGTYTGTASSFGGTLTVEVVVSGGAIADVKVVSHSDTPGISDAAIKDVPQRIIAANSPAVDVVSGATFTSEAIMDAVEGALAETSAAPGAENVYSDGTYTGTASSFGGKLTVEVVVSGGAIADVQVVSHSDTPGISDAAIKDVPQRIIAANSPAVDVVSGATFTSEAIMDAVENALAPSEETAELFDIQVSDGTYQGTGKGFGGDLVVEVTVSGGKITDITLVEHSETPFIAGTAIETLLPAMVEAGGPVDVYSGATMTSKALFEAVADAVSGSGDGAELFNIQVSDGTYQGTAKGFGGDLVVEVSVSGGKITDITVVEHSETPFIAGTAIETLLPAMVEAGGPVDVYSGATMTSKALFEAVAVAVSGEEGQ